MAVRRLGLLAWELPPPGSSEAERARLESGAFKEAAESDLVMAAKFSMLGTDCRCPGIVIVHASLHSLCPPSTPMLRTRT